MNCLFYCCDCEKNYNDVVEVILHENIYPEHIIVTGNEVQ